MDQVTRPRLVKQIWHQIEAEIESEYQRFERKNGRVDTIDRSEKLLEVVEEGVKHI